MEGDNTTDTTTMKMPEGASRGVTHSHLGPILGVLLILLVIIAVGLYLWGAELMRNTSTNSETGRVIVNDEPETPRAEADIQILETLSPSNEISAIEADVMSTNLDSIDADILVAEQELNAAVGAQ